MTHNILAMICCAGLALTPAYAAPADQGGSFFVAEIKGLLTQEQLLWAALESSFDVHSVGDASRISWSDNHQMAGTRIGPYRLWAKPKHSTGPFIFQLEIETQKAFYDNANLATDLEHATKVKEVVSSITIRVLKKEEFLDPDGN